MYHWTPLFDRDIRLNMVFHERINRSKFSNIALNSVKKWLCLLLVMSWSQMAGNIAVAVREHIFPVEKLPLCLEFVEFIFPLVSNLTWHKSLAQVFCARNKARQQYTSTNRQNVCFTIILDNSQVFIDH